MCMQPKLCTKCKKNIAVVFITKVENGVTMNEGYCLRCARSLGIPQIDDVVKQMGFSEDDLDSLSDEMSSMFGQIEEEEGDETEGRTATFPMLNQLFNNMGGGKEEVPAQKQETAKEDAPKEKNNKKHKFLDSYCMDLTGRAREGKLDKVIGRDVETERVIQILNRRQKNNPCLIGEPGVGKTAIAEGLAQRIVAGDVPYKLRDKEVFLLDLTALVAGTQFRGQFEVFPHYYSPLRNYEVDFLLQNEMQIIPVECKAGENVTSASFKRYRKEESPSLAIRFSTLQYKEQEDMINVPLYLAGRIKQIL